MYIRKSGISILNKVLIMFVVWLKSYTVCNYSHINDKLYTLLYVICLVGFYLNICLRSFQVILDWLPYIQSCINPIFYCFISRKFRKRMHLLLGRTTSRHPDSGCDRQNVTTSSELRHNHVLSWCVSQCVIQGTR